MTHYRLEFAQNRDRITRVKNRVPVTLDSVPRTFGGLPVPRFVESIASDAGEKYVNYCEKHIHAPRERAKYSAAIQHFCEWMDLHDYRLWSFSPVLFSAYLESRSLDGASPASVRLDWLGLRVFFDWCYSVGLTQMNVGVAVADPSGGFVSDELAESDHPGVIDVTARLVATA